jgi:tripartite-type tricarboxylate transporter receptor subunit TctC
MKRDTTVAFALVALAFAATLDVHAAQGAEAYPSKPIRLIVPFSPGGSADNLARTMQTPLGTVLGQSIVIDNRAGASSVIGSELAARAAPDGYTILLITTTFTVNPSLIRKLPYDPIRDFSPISLAVSQANILAVHPSVPAKSVKELVAYAKSKAGHVTYASGGSGSSPHLSGELFRLAAGIEATHVPYKGSGPGVAALLGGQVTMMFAGPLTFESHIKAGRIRALAVADRKRSALLPDVPTMAEAGYPGVETGTWYGFLGPVGMPPSVVQTVHEAIVKVMAQPAMKSRLAAQGVEIVGAGPKEFGQIIQEEIDKWAKLVKRAGITPG